MIQKLLAYYLIGINIFTFIMFWYDKRQALKKGSRISERELHILSALGGFLGGSFAMYKLRHKVAKRDFLVKHLLIILGWTLYGIYYFFYLNPLNFLR
jgi:uncharacterized membrane protein YsdA (DUF1294 family)